jgi:hypothetical protein
LRYEGPVKITGSCLLKVRAIKAGMNPSDLTAADFWLPNGTPITAIAPNSLRPARSVIDPVVACSRQGRDMTVLVRAMEKPTVAVYRADGVCAARVRGARIAVPSGPGMFLVRATTGGKSMVRKIVAAE